MSDVAKLADLADRVMKFSMLELPGQPHGMHMGTSYLVNDLWREVQRLDGLINTPEIEDFLQGVRLEAAHQRERWGDPHDREKSAEHWYWLVGYLSGKALRSAIEGNREKALHHTISSAAALRHWHSAIRQDISGNGRAVDADLAAHDAAVEAGSPSP